MAQRHDESKFAERETCGSCEFYTGDYGHGQGWCHAMPPIIHVLTNRGSDDAIDDVIEHLRPEVRATDVHCRHYLARRLRSEVAADDPFAGLI